jgi:hypothetical protein
MQNLDRFSVLLRQPRAQAAFWLACTLVLFLYLRAWSITRDVEFRVKLENVGAMWIIDWSPAQDTDRNGHWIDLGHANNVPRGAVIPNPNAPVLRVRMGNYGTREVALRWVDGPAGAKITVTEALVDDSVLGVPIRRTRLAPLRVEGEQPAAGRPTANTQQLAFPVSLTAGPGDGGVYFACTGPAWWYQVPVLAVSGAMAGALWAIIGLFTLLARRLDLVARTSGAGPGFRPTSGQEPQPGPEGRATKLTARLEHPRPGERWWALAAVATGLGVPIFLATWAPMLISGDSTAYILHTYLVHENHNFNHYDGWRLPGYPLLILPFYAWMDNYATGVALAQMVMGMLWPLLAWAMLRGRVPYPWPYVAAILVALDPGLFIWQRTLLTEAQVALFVMLSAFLFQGSVDRIRSGRGHAWLWPLGLALSLAAASYTRPNILVFGVLGPLALATITVLFAGGKRLAPAILCGAVFAACMAPVVIFNARVFDKPAVTVGSDWNREVWSWENHIMDWNQSGFFSQQQFEYIRAQCEARKFSWWDLPQHAQKWKTPPAPERLHEWSQMNERCRLLWKESAARRADAYLRMTPRAIGSMFGWPAKDPEYFHGDPYFLSGSLMGDDSHSARHGHTNYLIDIQAFPKPAQKIFERAMVPIGDVARSPQAAVVRWWYKAWAFARPAVSILFFFAIVRLLWVRELGLAALGVILASHMVAVPLLVFTGSDRYAMPWYGLMTVVTIAGLVWKQNLSQRQEARA